MTSPAASASPPSLLGVGALAAIHEEAAERRPWLDAQVILHRGELIFERYHNGCDAQSPHAMFSVTKSFLATLVGIALERGVLPTLDAPIGTWLAEEAGPDADPRKLAITVGDCLRMRSGLAWEEGGPTTIEWLAGADPLRYPFDAAEVVATPGERWHYSTLDSQLVGACLSRAAGCSLLEFADQYLFGPMGFGPHDWGTHVGPAQWRTDEHPGGSELFVRVRDLARFGELVRLGGEVDGRRIVSRAWVQRSTRRQSGVDRQVLARDAEFLAAASRWLDGYGLHWWRGTFAGFDALVACGHGGQYCLVIEALELVVAQAARELPPPGSLPLLERAVAEGLLSDDFKPAPGVPFPALVELGTQVRRAMPPGHSPHDDQTAGLALLEEVVAALVRA